MLGALLLADGALVSIDRLMDTVWGQRIPATAVKQIRNAISDLRRLHPDLSASLILAGDGYRLAVDDRQVDARTFAHRAAQARRLLAAGRTAQALEGYRSALALWRGPVLGGLDGAVLRAQTDALTQARLAAMEQRIDLELAAKNHHSILGELSAWVADHPLRERLVAQFMLALHRSGAQARAFMVYDRTRRILKDELGVSPGAELQEIRDHLLRGGLPEGHERIPTRGHNNLPPGVAHFTGRTREQRTLHETAGMSPATGGRGARPEPVVLAIDGMAGIGKTTLALHTAHRLAPCYPDGQLFVDMQACGTAGRPQEPHPVLGMLLCGLGVPPEDIPLRLPARIALWRRLVGDRRVLIVLDGVPDAHRILSLLPTTPGCLTLLTSRNRLTSPLVTRHLTVREMSPSEGHALFCKIVGDARPLREPAAVEYIVERCGGLPLAIRLAAAKLRHRPSWSPSYLASRLAAGKQWMSTLAAEGDSLAGVFRQSYEGLDPLQQHVFRVLGQVPPDRIEARAVAAVAGLSQAHADRLLGSLVDAHLLSACGPTRYGIHELVHAYAAQLADAVPLAQQAGQAGQAAHVERAVERLAR